MAIERWVTTILPVFLFTTISETTAAVVHECGVAEIPRPRTTFSFERLEADTRGCQLAPFAAAFRTPSQRSEKYQGNVGLLTVPTFLTRNSSASIFAA